jgi:hypothetical protein
MEELWKTLPLAGEGLKELVVSGYGKDLNGEIGLSDGRRYELSLNELHISASAHVNVATTRLGDRSLKICYSGDNLVIGAVRVGGNFINEIEYDQDAVWVSPAALTGAEPVIWDYPPYDVGEPPLQFDASQSIFEFIETANLPLGLTTRSQPARSLRRWAGAPHGNAPGLP